MPTELVLLADEEPTAQLLSVICEDLDPGGVVVESDAGGFRQVVGGSGMAAAFFGGQPLEDVVDARRMVVGGVSGYRWWIDVTVRYGDGGAGRAFVEAVAEACGAVIRERSYSCPSGIAIRKRSRRF